MKAEKSDCVRKLAQCVSADLLMLLDLLLSAKLNDAECGGMRAAAQT